MVQIRSQRGKSYCYPLNVLSCEFLRWRWKLNFKLGLYIASLPSHHVSSFPSPTYRVLYTRSFGFVLKSLFYSYTLIFLPIIFIKSVRHYEVDYYLRRFVGPRLLGFG